jgi:hypothetical protein
MPLAVCLRVIGGTVASFKLAVSLVFQPPIPPRFQLLYKMQDPMEFRSELTRMGLHAKFNRGELMRYLRNMHIGKVGPLSRHLN